MHAMVLHEPGQALRWEERPDPIPGPGQLRLRVLACAVCRTDLHVVDGELPRPKLPLVPGHEVVGLVDALGPGVQGFQPGQRVGVAWLAHACGHCRYCGEDRENLCDAPAFTGYTRDGGFATHLLAEAAFCLPINETPPSPLDAAILFAPVGALVPQALRAVRKGGRVVCGGIHMSDIPSFPYRLLWEERQLVSVANLTRRDGHEFLRLAADLPLQVRTTHYPLQQANQALADLRAGRFQGAAVLVPPA
jgi:D-arabinose 1-dehydrogenase-like Zn-dependent alcohol dehydrogenase